MRLLGIALVAALSLGAWTPAAAGAVLVGEGSPEWEVSAWINGDPGVISFHKGRVLVLHFFQMWCPASNNFSIPVMQRWQSKFGDRDDFMIVSIHTVFEGHEHQTPERLKKFLRRNQIWHPVGIDAYTKENEAVPVTMQRFGNIGTPQVAVIDKEGTLVFNHFGDFDVATVEFLLERLLKEESQVQPPPKPAIGRDAKLSGTYKLHFEQTSNTCADLAAPISTQVQLEFITDEMGAKFSRDFMGVSNLLAHYNSRMLKFSASESDERQVRGTRVRYNVTVQGGFILGSNPPKIEYNAAFRQHSDRPELDCMIKAKGTAVRMGN